MWVCSDCGGKNVQAKAWVNLNGEQNIEFVEGSTSDNWCQDCENHVKLDEVT